MTREEFEKTKKYFPQYYQIMHVEFGGWLRNYMANLEKKKAAAKNIEWAGM